MKTPTQKHFCVRLIIINIKIPVGQSQPTVGQYSRNARKKKEASTIHPHHCSKILFQNEDSHSKTIFWLCPIIIIIIIKIPVGQSQPTVPVSAAVGTLEKKKKLK